MKVLSECIFTLIDISYTTEMSQEHRQEPVKPYHKVRKVFSEF